MPSGRGIPSGGVAPPSNTFEYSRSSRLASRAPRSGIHSRGLDRLDSEILSQVFGQGRPRVSAALSSLRSSEAEPLVGLRRSLARYDKDSPPVQRLRCVHTKGRRCWRRPSAMLRGRSATTWADASWTSARSVRSWGLASPCRGGIRRDLNLERSSVVGKVAVVDSQEQLPGRRHLHPALIANHKSRAVSDPPDQRA